MRKASDAKDLVLKMYRENAEREDLSAFEIGGMFAQWLRSRLYKSQREISAATHLHETTVGQYVAIAELPAEVIAAFRDPRTISLRWSKELAKACRDRLKVILARAAKLAKSDPHAGCGSGLSVADGSAIDRRRQAAPLEALGICEGR